MTRKLAVAAVLLALSPASISAETERVAEGSGASPDAANAVQSAAAPAGYDAREEMTLTFMFHIDEDLAEQDVFIERVPGSGEVYRPTGATKDMDAPLYAPAAPVPHTPLQTENTGPWPKGKPLGITLGEWFSAKGAGTYSCENGVGKVDIAFENLVPNGVYTMWHDFAVWPPTGPLPGLLRSPLRCAGRIGKHLPRGRPGPGPVRADDHPLLAAVRRAADLRACHRLAQRRQDPRLPARRVLDRDPRADVRAAAQADRPVKTTRGGARAPPRHFRSRAPSLETPCRRGIASGTRPGRSVVSCDRSLRGRRYPCGNVP